MRWRTCSMSPAPPRRTQKAHRRNNRTRWWPLVRPMASEREAVDGFDYIVVGGGSAGCVVAARLAQDPGARVLLLEAGGSERTRATTVPNAWPENLGSAADWAGVTVPQAEAGPVTYPRGRTLGGSGAINGMAHVRGNRRVYDDWAAAGAKGWAFADLLPYFRRTECAPGRDPELRGRDGPIRVAPVPETSRHPVAAAFAAALTASGWPATDDLSGPNQEGVCWVDLAIADGQRVSPADGYVRPMLGNPNLVVRADCLVTKLRFTRGRCTGVSYVRNGAPALVSCSREVILCAGAIGTPQLLMLSGIGPANRLRNLGIGPVADAGEVGENLQDHPIALTSYATERDLDALAAGVTIVQQATSGRAFWGEFPQEHHRKLYPGPDVQTAADVRDYVRHAVGSYYHPVGTCRLGRDDRAVVDLQLRVQGIDGLRVADASVMPGIPNAHPHATVLAIAERAADLITSQK